MEIEKRKSDWVGVSEVDMARHLPVDIKVRNPEAVATSGLVSKGARCPCTGDCLERALPT